MKRKFLICLIVLVMMLLSACNINRSANTSSDIDTSNSSVPIPETSIEDENDYSQQIYDYYRTYDEALMDIENGFVFNMDYSFDEAAMPTVINNNTVSFYVHNKNALEINIILENLFDGTDQDGVKADSLVLFEVYEPSGETAFSFIREGKDIEKPTEITDELELYPGEWRYKISFAYTSNGLDTSRIVVAAKYKIPQEEDIQWLLDNKLNVVR